MNDSSLQPSVAQMETSMRDLGGKISDTVSYGFILQPRFVAGLTLIGDRIEIDLENGLSYFEPLNFLATCFDSSPQPADICAISQRNEQGHVISSAAITFNASSIRFRGETYNLSYAFPVGEGAHWGDLSTIEMTLYPILAANYRHNVSAPYDPTEQMDEMPSFPSTSYGDILGRQYSWAFTRSSKE